MKKKILFIVSALSCMSANAQQDTTSVELDNVVVTGTRDAADVRHLPMTVTVVGREKLTENERPNIMPTLTEQVPSLFTTSRGLLGYGVSGGGSGSISLRGISAGSGQLLVLIDGHPQYQGVYGHPIADSYQTLMAERVEVLRGPASMLYGSNAMGGVINIVTRGMKENGVRTNISLGAGSWGTFQAEASNQVRSQRFSSTVAVQYQRSDNHRPNMAFEQYGGYLKLAYDICEHWNVFADGNITRFNASNPGTTDEPMLEADQWITRGAVALGVENKYEKTNGRLSVYDNFGIHKINDGYKAVGGTPQTDLFRSKDYLLGISWFQTFNLFTGNHITTGVDYQHIYGRAWYTNRHTGEEVTEGQRIRMKQAGQSRRNEIACYIDVRQNLFSWLTLNAGVRIDHHSVSGTEWIPQGGIVVRPLSNGEIKAMVSKGFRNPSMREMYLYPPSTEELEPERMMNYELSWKHRLLDNAVTYGINLFYLKGDNMIVTNTAVRRNENTGEIRNYGAELEAVWRINEHWSLNTNHSWMHMKNPILSVPEYKGYVGASYRCSKWSVSAGLMQLAGLYTATGDKEQKECATLFNATIGYQLVKNLNLWVKGENLFAQRYETYAGYPMPRATFMGGVNVNF